MTVKLLSLFDGSGGFPLAASLCGIEPKYASEVEPYPIAVTRSRFPNMVHLGDVSKVSGYDLEPCSVITFGSPCQDMSIAGKRRGIKHEAAGDAETTRSGLFYEAARIIKEMREATNGRYPEFIVWENVPGAFSSNKGEDFRTVLQTLIEIVEPGAVMPPVPKMGWAYADYYCGDGWSLAYRTFDAQYWGVPQRRRRIYLVLDLRGQRAGKVLFEREGVRGYFTPCRASGEEASAGVERGAGVCDKTVCIPINTMIATRWNALGRGTGLGIGKDGDMQFTISAAHEHAVCVPLILDDQGGQQITVWEDGVSPTLRAEMHGHPPCVVSAGFKGRQGENSGGVGFGLEIAPTFVSGMTTDVVCKCFDARGNGDGKVCSTISGDHESRITDYTTVVCMEHGQANAEVCENMSPCLNCNHEQPIVFDKEAYNSGVNAKGAPYISEGGPAPCLRTGCPPGVCIRYIVRRLTPTECCRLQGFPDGWGEIDPLDVSDSREAKFWLDVYKTYCAMIGRNLNPSIVGNPDSLKKWHDKLHTDSAEYKMWGNGIALPNALYVMQGIVENI